MFAASERRCANVQNFQQRKERKCSLENTHLCSVSFWPTSYIYFAVFVLIFVKRSIIVFV